MFTIIYEFLSSIIEFNNTDYYTKNMKIWRNIAVCLLATSTAVNIFAADDTELEELRSLVMDLKSEVQVLKGQLGKSDSNPDIQKRINTIKQTVAQGTVEQMKPTVQSKYGLDFYGYFKLDAFYDSDVLSHQEIPFWAIPNSEYSDGVFDMTAKETRLGLNFGGPEVSGGKVSGKLEFDFYGRINSGSSLSTNHAFQMRSRHAYLNWDFGEWSLLAGQTWEPYLIVFPKTVNFTYNNFVGQLGLRKSQLRLTRKVNSNLEVVGAILEPVGGVHGADVDGDLQDDGANSGMPVFSGKVVYKTTALTEKPATFGASFVYGQEVFDLFSKTYDSWAVVGAFSLPLTDQVTWSSSFYKGANVDSFWGGIGQGINHSLRREIGSVGGWTELRYQPNSEWMFNLGWAMDNPDDEDLWSGARTKNQHLRVNMFYNFSSSLVWGLEYLNIETGYKNAAKATGNRVQSSIIFKF